jgi:hypothetical protein
MATSRSGIRRQEPTGQKLQMYRGIIHGQRVSQTGWRAPEEEHTETTKVSPLETPAPHTRSCSPRRLRPGTQATPPPSPPPGRGGAVHDVPLANRSSRTTRCSSACLLMLWRHSRAFVRAAYRRRQPRELPPSSCPRDRWHRPSSSRRSSALCVGGWRVGVCSPIRILRAHGHAAMENSRSNHPPCSSYSSSSSLYPSTSASTPAQVGMWGAEVGLKAGDPE